MASHWQQILLVLVLICVTDTLSRGVHRGKRQVPFTCKATETEIKSPWIYRTDTTCGDLIGELPDIYNDVYLNECQRQLGLDDKPTRVSDALVKECYKFSNGTIKYQASLCCPGTITGLRCFTCEEIPVQYDSSQGKYVTDHCNHYQSVESCPTGQVCTTRYDYGSKNTVTKRCMPKDNCMAEQTNNSKTCKSYEEPPSCTYCCETPLCNYYRSWSSYVPGPRPPPSRPCIDYNACNNGGTCVLSNDSSGYTCLCQPGTWGSYCQSTMCSYSPCKNRGSCSRVSSSEPYYSCSCRLGWHGTNCTEAYENCDASSDFCMNGGTCFNQTRGLDCLCPHGYHGERCELKVFTPEDCSSPELHYNYSRNGESSSTSNRDCTRRNADFESSLTGWGHNCISYMGKGFKQGQDGDISDAKLERYGMFRCERGDTRTWYRRHMCCPACTAKPCQNGGWCIQEDKGFSCKCRLGYGGDRCQYREALCYVSGDPHYLTWDGRQIPFQGPCKYNMVRTLAEAMDNDTQVPFQVLVKHERRGSGSTVSYVHYLELLVYEYVVRLDKDNKVYADGNEVDLSDGQVSLPNGKVMIQMNGQFVSVRTDFGLTVENDGYWTGLVKMPTTYVDMTDGLCGNNNGDPADDLTTKEGEDMTDDDSGYSIWGNSWQVDDPEDENCAGPVEPNPVGCPPELEDILQSDEYCGLIMESNTDTPFQTCLSTPGVMGPGFLENCRFDVCANQPDAEAMKQAACGTLMALASNCINKGVVVDWRAAANCPLNCTGGQEYRVHASPCKITCTNPKAVERCTLPNTETCTCPGSQVLKDGVCVNKEECGCIDEEGENHEVGKVWLSKDCDKQYTCNLCTNCDDGFGSITTRNHACGNDEVCKNHTCSDDPCHSVTCQNGGSCSVNQDAKAICTCVGYWSGEFCETEPCMSGPCQNGSTCTPTSVDGYVCNCTEGYEGTNCETEIWYEYGAWSDWICISTTYQKRNRTCYKYPGKVETDSNNCEGPRFETREPPVDCDNNVGGFVENVCDESHYWVCVPGGDGSWIKHPMPCPPCTKWDQDLLTCIYLDEPCDVQGTTTKGPTPTPDAKEITCIDFENVGEWGFSGTNWVWISNIGPDKDIKYSGCGMVGDACGHFSGNSRLDFTPNADIQKQFSVSLWVKYEGSYTYGTEYLCHNGACDQCSTFAIARDGLSTMGSNVKTTKAFYGSAIHNEQISQSDWHHVVIIFDSMSDTLKMYVDNNLVQEGLVEGLLEKNRCEMSIGQNFRGYMDEVCFYEGVLNNGQRDALYNSGTGQ